MTKKLHLRASADSFVTLDLPTLKLASAGRTPLSAKLLKLRLPTATYVSKFNEILANADLLLKTSKLISNVLDIFVAARLIEDHWQVYECEESLGLKPCKDTGPPYEGFIPVTPMMDTQLDDLIIRHLLAPLSTQFLRRLEDKILEQRRENWLEIHLAIFVIMSNFGWILKDMMHIAKWKGIKVSFLFLVSDRVHNLFGAPQIEQN